MLYYDLFCDIGVGRKMFPLHFKWAHSSSTFITVCPICSKLNNIVLSCADQSGRAVYVMNRLRPLVDSNPTRGMDVCLRLFCVCVVLCVGSGLATG
jgi:hypothetical protein